MITILHKLYPTKKQETILADYLWSSIGIENWAIGQIRHSIEDGFPLACMKKLQLRSILSKKISGHSKRCGLPSALLNNCIMAVCETVSRHGIHKTKLKSARKKNSFYLSGGGSVKIDNKGRLKVAGIKASIKMSEQNKFLARLPKVTFIKKYDGWYVACVYDMQRTRIEVTDSVDVGIDPGLADKQLVLSNGDIYKFPRHYKKEEGRIAKLQRLSKNSKRLKAVQRKVAARRKDHHHKLSTEMAKKYQTVYWSNDNFANLKQCLKFGKTYSDISLGAFRDMLQTKLASRADELGRLIKVSNKLSTQTCSSCGEVSFKDSTQEADNRLAVRNWYCSSCGATHCRDQNAAINTLISGRGATAIE